jgi:hypothetical protein
MCNWISSIWLYMIATMEQIMGLRITILELGTQDTLINTSISQVGLFFHPTNHIINAMWQLYWTHKWTQIQTLTLVNPKLVINTFLVLDLQHDWPNMTHSNHAIQACIMIYVCNYEFSNHIVNLSFKSWKDMKNNHLKINTTLQMIAICKKIHHLAIQDWVSICLPIMCH